MARPLRIQYPGAWYHITCRGNERVSIFRDDKDRQKFLEILEESAQDFSVEVHCYCIMSNHFHFLLKTRLANLNRFMQRFNTAYIVYFNRRHRRAGHLYQGRYKAILIDADSYLLELSRYIHLNPIRIKRLKKASLKEKIEVLDQYPWSSYRAYTGRNGPSFLNREMILAMVEGKGTRNERAYREFVLEGIRESISNPLEEKKAHSVLGGEKFLQWVYNTFVQGKEGEKEYSRVGELVPILTVEEIAREVALEFGVKTEELLHKYSRAEGARKILIELSCRYAVRNMSLKEIGQKLGVSVGGLVMSRRRFRKRLGKNKKLRNRFENIEKNLLRKC